MANELNFPLPPVPDGTFHTDPNDMRWQWSEFKHRWSFKPPSALSSAYTESETPPDDTSLPWFQLSTGVLSIWSEGDDAWIACSGPGNDGEDGEDLTETITPSNIATEEHTFVTANISQYLCFTFSGAKTAYVIPTDGTFAPAVGDILTVRNDSEAGDITIEAAGGVPPVIKGFTGAEVVAPDTTAQLIYRGDQVWHLQ